MTILAEATENANIAIRKAGLDWEVQRVDLGTADTLDLVPDCAAIRRSDSQSILGVVGPDYVRFLNRKMFDVITELSAAGRDGGFSTSIETAGPFQRGRVVWALSHIPQLGIHIGDDESKTYLLVSSGHTGNRTLIIAPTMVRVVYQNILRMVRLRFVITASDLHSAGSISSTSRVFTRW